MSSELVDVQKAVAEFDRVAAGIAELKKRYENVVYDVATSKGMTLAKEARMAIRAPRFEVEKIRKAAKAPILALGKKLDTEAARITSELEKLEQPIDSAIKAEEDRKERERQAKVEAELKRVADLQERVVYLRGNPTLSATTGSALIAEHISDLEGEVVDDSLQEFRQQAEDAKAAGLSRLRELHAAALAHEAEQARIKSEREELAKLRAEQEKRDAAERARIAEEERQVKAARDAEAARQAETLRIEQEKLAAERARIADEERQAKAARAAEEERLAKERAEFERQQADAKKVREAEEKRKAEQARLAAMKPPSAGELIEVLARHYQVPATKIVDWILATDFSEVRAA